MIGEQGLEAEVPAHPVNSPEVKEEPKREPNVKEEQATSDEPAPQVDVKPDSEVKSEHSERPKSARCLK